MKMYQNGTRKLTILDMVGSSPWMHLNSQENEKVKDTVSSPTSPRGLHGYGRDGNSAVVQKYQQYEDSVYGIAWSSRNPWLFATLSYDGQMLLHLVPKAEKYRLLM